MVTAFFGAVLLDVVYARLAPEAETAFAEAADFLLCIGGVTVLAAIGAIAFSWGSSGARNCFMASLAALLLEFLAPVFLSPLVQEAQGSVALAVMRVAISGSASVLAFVGLHQLYRQG